MHVDASDIYPSALVFYTRHQVNITIYRTVYLHTDMCLQRNPPMPKYPLECTGGSNFKLKIKMKISTFDRKSVS
jgi:hypothetical protein